ncbi:MAG: type I DNA topoisomerase [Pseudomonadota bacterium]|nr:type I DNA topoisomerase [Pseudomonadota bacterium]
MNVVVVESPAKAKTINKYLGSDYKVLASYGHIRDLPSRDGSVRPDEDFAMEWEVDPKASKRMSDIADALKGADRLILATDPDREGEAISWHVLEVLKKKRALKDASVQRVTFNSITRSAVTEAMARPREIDMELVDAYLARRALDYLVGFTLSPVLWRKLPGAKSAGRVQSVALRLVVDRELEIEAFRPQEYWTVGATVTAGGEPFPARLVTLNRKRLGKFDLPDEAAALQAKKAVQTGDFSIHAIETKPGRRAPPPPFTTSTLQQEAARKLGFNATRTMQAAQRLYEGVDIGGETVGLITYMRTDGVQVTPEALDETRRFIGRRYGAEYVPESARIYKTKARNAQEAHEAIRPTSLERDPARLHLEPDLRRLYELIWKRMVASQMESARVERTTVDIATPDGATVLRANGQVVLFEGYLAVYEEGRDAPDPRSGSSEQDSWEGGDERRLPAVQQGAAAQARDVSADQHFTEPPPRYSEASLVKAMEELGIGRPSTYASILQVLRDRAYVRMDKNRFVPEDKGRLVTAFLEQFFNRYVEYDFTADLEQRLDAVSAGDLEYKVLLRDFWRDFQAAVAEIGELRITEVLDALNEAMGPQLFPEREDGQDPRLCPSCAIGRLSLKTSRFGAFVGCSNYPECRFTRAVGQPDPNGEEGGGDRELGVDPETGLPVHLKVGRFGPFVQLGEGGGKDDKPKRSSLPKGWTAAGMDLDRALKLLNLPREVGLHPEDGQPILAALGRYGPYVQHGKTYANVETIEDVFEIGINRAVALIAEKRAGGGRPQRGASAAPLKEFGKHPETGEPIVALSGRYGDYLKSGSVNVTLPKGADLGAMTLEQAAGLVTAKAAMNPGKSKRGAKSTAGAKKPGRKTPARKAAKGGGPGA